MVVIHYIFSLRAPSMIKNLPNVAIIIPTALFNAINMIPKTGKDLTVPTSYRPISLLPCLSKLFEKVFHRKIIPLLN